MPGPEIPTLPSGSKWGPLDAARFRSLVEETVLPPTTSIELRGGAALDFQNRLDRRAPHVGEAFIANTRLSRRGVYAERPDPAGPSELWRMLTELSYNPNPEDLEPGASDTVVVDHERLDPRLATVLRTTTDPAGAGQAFFAVDMFLVLDGSVARQPLGRPFIWRERTLPEAHRFDAAVLERPADLAPLAWIVLVGAPWRYMMFYGPRGLRRAWIDTGRALSFVTGAAMQAGLVPWVGMDVLDREMEELLMLDGVERFVAAVCALSPREESHE